MAAARHAGGVGGPRYHTMIRDSESTRASAYNVTLIACAVLPIDAQILHRPCGGF